MHPTWFSPLSQRAPCSRSSAEGPLAHGTRAVTPTQSPPRVDLVAGPRHPQIRMQMSLQVMLAMLIRLWLMAESDLNFFQGCMNMSLLMKRFWKWTRAQSNMDSKRQLWLGLASKQFLYAEVPAGGQEFIQAEHVVEGNSHVVVLAVSHGVPELHSEPFAKSSAALRENFMVLLQL